MVISSRMRRRLARLWVVVPFSAALVLCAASASAQSKVSVDKASKELKTADDWRVRAQAALALGSTKSKAAVLPLCRGLEDKSPTVRAASAAALGKLKLGGRTCLEKRLESEAKETVKTSIKKALAQFEGAGPAITNGTRYYLAIGKTVDKTGRAGGGVEKLVRSAMAKAAKSMDGYAVAPEGQKDDEAKKLLSDHKKVKAFYLSPKVQEPAYTGGNLTIRLEVAIFTYPSKALKGTIPIKLTAQDVSSKDTDSEDELIQMAAQRAVEKFVENVERIQ
jgi:hypothetical protein